jgi:hypothetical protein
MQGLDKHTCTEHYLLARPAAYAQPTPKQPLLPVQEASRSCRTTPRVLQRLPKVAAALPALLLLLLSVHGAAQSGASDWRRVTVHLSLYLYIHSSIAGTHACDRTCDWLLEPQRGTSRVWSQLTFWETSAALLCIVQYVMPEGDVAGRCKYNSCKSPGKQTVGALFTAVPACTHVAALAVVKAVVLHHMSTDACRPTASRIHTGARCMSSKCLCACSAHRHHTPSARHSAPLYAPMHSHRSGSTSWRRQHAAIGGRRSRHMLGCRRVRGSRVVVRGRPGPSQGLATAASISDW